MTKLTREEILAEHFFDAEKVGQMQGNMERMERESTTNMPALDSKSRANSGKTQYEIDRTIKDEYASKRDNLVTLYPEVFEVKPEEVTK